MVSREIKFRCFDLETKAMNYWDLDHYDRENHDVFGNVMQFIGLSDRNGKDIYEGDVTKSGYTIMWSNDKCLFAEHLYQEILGKWSIMSYPIDPTCTEVTGNIHEL